MQAVITYNPAFEQFALNEINRTAASSPTVLHRPALGTAVITLPIPYQELAQRWLARPPIYLHHAFPVQRTVPTGPASVKDDLVLATRGLPPGARFSVQARAWDYYPAAAMRALEAAIEERIQRETGVVACPRAPQSVVSIVISRDAIFCGVSPSTWNLSPWPGGAVPAPPDRGRLNRSELKLFEALETFRLPIPKHARALDFGASPGGWTRVLLSRGLQVVAVDPDPLSEEVAGHPRVRSVRMRAEAFLCLGDGPFDVIVNDMILSPQDSARLMCLAASMLKSEGHCILTLKLGGSQRARSIDHALRILRSSYRIPRMKQLFYNKNEITLWLRLRRPYVGDLLVKR